MSTLQRALLAAALACLSLPVFAQDPSNPITAQVKIYGILGSGGMSAGSSCVFQASSVQNAISIASTSAGSATVSKNPATIVKPIDNCSATIFASALIGRTLPFVGLLVHPVQPTQRSYVLFFQNVRFAGVATAATTDQVLQESVSLNYQTVSVAEVDQSFRVVSCFGFSLTKMAQDSSGCAEIPVLIKEFVPPGFGN